MSRALTLVSIHRFRLALTALLLLIVFIPTARPAAASDLEATGTFYGNDNGVYYIQQLPNHTVWWLGESVDAGKYPEQVWHRGLASTSVFKGTVSNSTITGDWVEVSRGSSLRRGSMTLAMDTVTDGLGTHVRLTLTAGTTPNGVSSWVQGDSINDQLFVYPDGHAEIVNFFDRFALSKKTISPGVSDLDNGDPLGETHNPHELRPYRDQTVFYGNMQTVSPDNNTNHWPQIQVPPPGSANAKPWSYSNFACNLPEGKDGDIDMNMRVDGTSMTSDFTSGLGWSTINARDEKEDSGDDSQDILPKIQSGGSFASGFNLHLESVMYAGGVVAGCPSSLEHYLPGWADSGGNSLLINGRPVDAYNHPEHITVATSTTRGVDSGSTAIGSINGHTFNPADPPNGVDILHGTEVRVTGAMILDCGHSAIDDDENYEVTTDSFPYRAFKSCEQQEGDEQNQELHPFYSMDLIECPLGYVPEYCSNNQARQNLTGAWGSNDGGTYYIRQVGNDIWWAGLTRDRDPTVIDRTCTSGFPPVCTQVAIPNPIPNPTDVFHGTITNHADGSATISGEAVTVPKGQESGGLDTTATFTVGADRKSMDLSSSSSGSFPWPVHFDKLYEPDDHTAPTSTLTIGDPQFSAAGHTYVTSATPLTLASSDSDVQSLSYRIYPSGSTAPAYTSIDGDTTTLHVTGADGSYTVDYYATDGAGNDESPHTMSVYLDTSGPNITITAPADATSYTLRQALTASYSCADPGSGVASCTGTLPNGATIDTSALGSFTFTVDATDNLANASSKTSSYFVSYRICPLYNPSKALGSPNSSVAIKVQICDANNANLSSPTIALTALNVDGSKPAIPAGASAPGNLFRYDASIAGYIFNLQTKGLTSGRHVLNFSVQGDPGGHAAVFILK